MNSNLFRFTTPIGPVELTIAPPELPPFEFDAIVEEQDTGLILGLDANISEPNESYDTLVSQMLTEQPRLPGDVVIKGDNPMRFLAVVHDLEQTPTWNKEWIANAMIEIFKASEHNRIRSLAMPILGSINGSFDYEAFPGLFQSALPTGGTGYPEKIWLIVPAPECIRIINLVTRRWSSTRSYSR